MTMHKHDNQAALDAYSGGGGIVADVRLDLDTTTQVKLVGLAGTSKILTVNGLSLDCSTAKTCAKTANLIASDGTDAGAAMSVSTFYYGYASNANASYAASSLRFSATAPTDGYLAASGNGANWRYVGDVYLQSDGYFKDSDTERLVRSEFNTRAKSLRAYNSTASWTYASATWQEFNAGTGQTRAYFLGDGKTSIVVQSRGEAWSNGTNRLAASGIGYDSATTPSGTASSVYSNSGGVQSGTQASHACIPAIGLHYLTQLERTDGSTCEMYGTGNTFSGELLTTIPC